jgi:multiple sugar transport system permease protein/putative aldouronate transport system permease protein
MAMTKQQKLDSKAEKRYAKTHKKKNKHTTIGDLLFDIVNHIFFIAFTLACIFPFYYLFINTISNNDLVGRGVINFIPRGIQFQNYISIMNAYELRTSLLVTLGRTVIGTALMVAASGFVGYLVTKKEMWGR